MRFEHPGRRVYLAVSGGIWLLGMLSASQAGQPAAFFWWSLLIALIVWPIANAFCYVELRARELVVRNFLATTKVARDQITGVTKAYVWGSSAVVAAAVLKSGAKLRMHALYFGNERSLDLVDEAQRRVHEVEAWLRDEL